MSMRVAVVGCGASGTRRARVLRELGVDELTLSDKDPARSRRLEAAGCGTVARSMAAAVAGAEAVLVCTPACARAGIALEAVRAGAHVFVEAPLSDSLASASLVLEAAATYRRVVMVSSRARFHPGLERLRTLLEAGSIGRVYLASLWIGAGLPIWGRSDTHGQAAEGSGQATALDVVEWWDLLRWLFGKPVQVTAACAEAYPGSGDGEELRAAIVRVGSGAVIQVYTDGIRGPETSRIEITGTEGTLCWSAAGQRVVLDRRTGEDRRVEEIPVDTGELEAAELRHFLACTLAGRTPVTDAAEGRDTLALALALRRSARIRRTLRLGQHAEWSAGRRPFQMGLRLIHAAESPG